MTKWYNNRNKLLNESGEEESIWSSVQQERSE